MSFRGQGKWTEGPNVPWRSWQEPKTPNIERWQPPIVNTGAQRNYEGGERWARTPAGSVTAQIVGGHVAKKLRDVKRKQREASRTEAERVRVEKANKAEQEKTAKMWSAPKGKGVPVPPAPESASSAPAGTPMPVFSTPSAPEKNPRAQGSILPPPMRGTHARTNKPPLIDPSLSAEQIKRRRTSGY